MLKSFLSILLLSLVVMSTIQAQSFGFGCLGLSGVYAGYSIQKYEPLGLNAYIKFISDPDDPNNDVFGEASGYRFGANIFRAQFDRYFFSIKGFYQFLEEKHSVDILRVDLPASDEYKLRLDYWGIGVDFGVPLFHFLDWKIIDGGVTFSNYKFTSRLNFNSDNLTEIEYDQPKTFVGYYVATGIVIHLVKDYLSLEGTAFYNQLRADHLESGDGLNQMPPKIFSENFVDAGGFNGLVQLNIGVPL